MNHSDFENEIKLGQRFEFGKNWSSFLNTVNEDNINNAQISFLKVVGEYQLNGKSFLDIGSGSGLSSLVAKRLGANVFSFDYDPNSVNSTKILKERYYSNDSNWTIEQGSILDKNYVEKLGKFDFVYSWGVLHHTGDMWNAIENAQLLVNNGGLFFIAIYNDQGFKSQIWKMVKRIYCSGYLGKLFVKLVFIPYFSIGYFLSDLIKLRNPFSRYSIYKEKRGMSIYHDWIDWLGGYPFEVAKPEEINSFFDKKGFSLKKIIATKRLGCNEFIFSKNN